MTPEQNFLARLSLQDRVWLEQLWQHAQRPPPAHWVRWCMSGGDKSVNLGFLSPARAHWLQAHLRPLPKFLSGHMLWPSAHADCTERSQWLGEILHRARQQELVSGWRDEMYAWWPHPAIPPSTEHLPAFMAERAGFRHLGLLSHAVHIQGFLPQGDLWCARRSMDKATDPGLLDNLAAGGLKAGENPLQSAVRELHEEAGLSIDTTRLAYRGSVRTCRAEPEGWHDERLLVFHLTLSQDEIPCNLDGEVQNFECLTPGQWVARLRQQLFTADAAAATVCGLGLTPPSIR